MALSADAVKRLMIGTASADAGNELATAINKGVAHATQSPVCVVAAIVATNVSQTIDFASLAVGDKVMMIPATAGNADFITIATAGNLGQAAVVGNLYVVLRPLVLDATSALVF
jgi:hypothetical protein